MQQSLQVRKVYATGVRSKQTGSIVYRDRREERCKLKGSIVYNVNLLGIKAYSPSRVVYVNIY